MRAGAGSLTGRRILVVEDEFMIADLIGEGLKVNGAEIAGPAATVRDALTLTAGNDRIDGAVLDVSLRGETVYPVADILQSRGVPLVFMTGYDTNDVPPRFAGQPCLQKPVSLKQLVQALGKALGCSVPR